MARPAKRFAVERVLQVAPALGAGTVRSVRGFAPNRFQARVLLREPPGLIVQVDIQLVVGGAPRIREMTILPGIDFAVPITTSVLRQIAVEQLVLTVLTEIAKVYDGKTTERPDVAPGAFQVGGENPNAVNVSPHPDLNDRVIRAARIYQQGRAEGSRAPTEGVARELNVSRSQASRYIRTARKIGLIPPVGAPEPGPMPEWEQYAPPDDVRPVQHPGIIPQPPWMPPEDGAPRQLDDDTK